MEKKLLEEIDDLLSRLEDFTHGEDGYKITKLRAKIANHVSFKIKIRVKEIKYGLYMTKESNNINKISTFCKKCQAIICECETEVNKSAEDYLLEFNNVEFDNDGEPLYHGLQMIEIANRFSASENARLREENDKKEEAIKDLINCLDGSTNFLQTFIDRGINNSTLEKIIECQRDSNRMTIEAYASLTPKK